MATRDVLNHDNRSDIHTLKMHSNTLKGAEHYRHSTPIASLEFTYKKKVSSIEKILRHCFNFSIEFLFVFQFVLASR